MKTILKPTTLATALALVATASLWAAPAQPRGERQARVDRQVGRQQERDQRPDRPRRMSQRLRALADSSSGEMVDVIIRYKAMPSRFEADRVRGEGGQTRREFRRFPMRAVRVPARMLERLSDHPNIEFVTRDAPIEAFSSSARLTANVDDGPVDYSVPEWDFSVAVLDSGVGFHTDIWPTQTQFDFVGSPNYPPWGAGDPFGHGSHVAGVIVGDGWSSGGAMRGVAPQAGLLSLRVLDRTGRGVVSDVLYALEWLLDNANAYNVKVVNLSFGKALEEAAEDDPLVQAVEAVWDAGIVVVCSAGNYGRDGHGTITSPGNSRKVITVGSITDSGTGGDFDDDYVSTYSSKGPTRFDHFLKPDLVAPGNRYVAALSYEALLKQQLVDRLVDCGQPSCGGVYLELSGTSMAAAMVTGAVATMLEADPSLSPDTVKARLMRSARKVADTATSIGAGVLDLEAALAETGVIASAPSPRMARSEEGNVILVEDTARLWGPEWAAGFIWSDGFIWNDSYAYADGFIWSDGFLWDEGFVWSDGFLWDEGFIWNDGFLWDDGFIWNDRVDNDDPLMSVSSQGVTLNDD